MASSPHKRVEILGSSLCKMTKLEYLWLEDRSIDQTDGLTFSHLRYLTLSDVDGQLPTSLPCLQMLTIESNNHLMSLSGTIGMSIQNSGYPQNSLKEVEIRSCPLLRLEDADSIGHWSALNILEIDSCESLSSLPETIGKIGQDYPGLTEVTIRRCPLECLPDSIGQWSFLRRLEIDSCESLLSLPDTIGDIGNYRDEFNLGPFLEEVKLRRCPVKRLPHNIADWTGLKLLEVESCESLSPLPKLIGKLRSLRKVKRKGCELLKKLPRAFLQLKSLEHLELSDTFLRRVPNMKN